MRPCILPLVPGYLGFVGGFAGGSGEGATDRENRRRLLLGVALFILGFSVVFVTFGLLFGVAGLLLKQWMDVITRIAGVIITAIQTFGKRNDKLAKALEQNSLVNEKLVTRLDAIDDRLGAVEKTLTDIP